MALTLSQSQRISQKQLQKLGQAQIQALKYLSMSTMDLRKEIYEAVENNIALEIKRDAFEDGEIGDGDLSVKQSPGEADFKNLSDYTRFGTVTSSGEEKAQAYQEMLESRPDERETLSDHLINQFNMLNLPENQKRLGEKLIYNLDKEGFHILAPVSFLDYATDTEEDLNTCLSIIQNLEPQGCCCKDVWESLFIQGKNSDMASDLSLFILDGHMDFLDPPVPAKILKKLSDFEKEESKKAFNTTDYSFLRDLDEEDLLDTISFIKGLTPHPAANYGFSENLQVQPDVRVQKIPLVENDQELGPNVINGKGDNAHSFVVTPVQDLMPKLAISSEYLEVAEMQDIPQDEKKKIAEQLQKAKELIESLDYRNNSIFNAALAIVSIQVEFFEHGQGRLVPLKQKDLAELLGVHETTISRMANSKYLECEWGMFPFKYFFVGGVSQVKEPDEGMQDDQTVSVKPEAGGGEENSTEISKDRIIFEIKQILDAQPPEAKKLSDQKLSDMLLERGIKVARRTIAKYRGQIGVKSSYDR